jgi:apyrase
VRARSVASESGFASSSDRESSPDRRSKMALKNGKDYRTERYVQHYTLRIIYLMLSVICTEPWDTKGFDYPTSTSTISSHLSHPHQRTPNIFPLSRQRNVGILVAIPVILIIAVITFMPRSTDITDDFNRAQPFSRKHYENGSTSSTGEARYGIVIDAGSTGSRVHIFKFLTNSQDLLELQFDKFDQLKPGLSAYAQDPRKAAESLQPLLDLAIKTVPASQHSKTPIMVGATAGLRLLPDGKADSILAEVRTWLSQFQFKFTDADIKILSGVDEGAFAWLTLNYLLGHLGQKESNTVAAIDLGGGSVQEAYAMAADEVTTAPDAQYLTQLRGGGRQYHVYVYSYLGYGLMAARAGVLDEQIPEGGHPCVPAGYEGSYTYGDKTYDMVGGNTPASADSCGDVVLASLKHQLECGAPQLQCTFNGAWGGSKVPQVFYISSYFWDRASDAGLVEEDAIQAHIKPADFTALADRICSAPSIEAMGSLFPRVHQDLRPYFCLDISYIHTLLIKGFKIPEEATVTLVKRVEYNGEHIEAAWPLGAAINMLN